MIRRSHLVLAALGASLVVLSPRPALAQGVRGDVRIVGSLIEYQTVVRKSLPEDQVPGEGITRKLDDGTWVTCVPGGDCYWYESGPEKTSTPLVEELRLTSWGGPRGLSAQVHLRSRFGGSGYWPREDLDFEALNAYVQLERTDFQAAGGRLIHRGGLGYYVYDGASFTWKGWRTVRLEAFGGWSRARTINQPRTGSLLAAADDLPPDKASTLWGGQGTVTLGRTFDASLLYQRELRTDRYGLYSDRMALDADWRPRPVRVQVTGDFDVAALEFNEAALRLTRTFSPLLYATLNGRYYRPFLELWTIWGAFSPVGYTEAAGSVYWNVTPEIQVWGEGGYRDYQDTSTEADFIPVEGDGWRTAAGGSWTPDRWSLTAQSGYNRGFGAFQSSFDLFAGRNFASGAYLGVFGTASQQFAEFRFGEGTTRGGGVQANAPVGRLSTDFSLGLFSQTYKDRPRFEDYDQWRGRLAFTYQIGRDPGMTGRRGVGR